MRRANVGAMVLVMTDEITIDEAVEVHRLAALYGSGRGINLAVSTMTKLGVSMPVRLWLTVPRHD